MPPFTIWFSLLSLSLSSFVSLSLFSLPPFFILSFSPPPFSIIIYILHFQFSHTRNILYLLFCHSTFLSFSLSSHLSFSLTFCPYAHLFSLFSPFLPIPSFLHSSFLLSKSERTEIISLSLTPFPTFYLSPSFTLSPSPFVQSFTISLFFFHPNRFLFSFAKPFHFGGVAFSLFAAVLPPQKFSLA